jgi:hypothetical protein
LYAVTFYLEPKLWLQRVEYLLKTQHGILTIIPTCYICKIRLWCYELWQCALYAHLQNGGGMFLWKGKHLQEYMTSKPECNPNSHHHEQLKIHICLKASHKQNWRYLYITLETTIHNVRSEVFTAVRMMMLFFWFSAPCRLISRWQHFRETDCLHLQGWRWRQPWRWRQYVSPQCQLLLMSLHDAKTQNNSIINHTQVKNHLKPCCSSRHPTKDQWTNKDNWYHFLLMIFRDFNQIVWHQHKHV